jgi:hypothetical protein
VVVGSPLTVAGAAAELRTKLRAHRIPILIPEGNRLPQNRMPIARQVKGDATIVVAIERRALVVNAHPETPQSSCFETAASRLPQHEDCFL